MSENSSRYQNYNTVDLLKFICAVLVVIIHVNPFGAKLSNDMSYGLSFYLKWFVTRPAVPFFFVSASFFLFRKDSLQDHKMNNALKYSVRMLRLYLVWTIIYLPLIVKDMRKDVNGIFHALKVLLRNCIIYGSYGHLWFITALIFAVLLTSYLLYKHVKPSHIIVLAGIFYLIGLLKQSRFAWIDPLDISIENGLLFGFLFVSLGMLFAYYQYRISMRRALAGFIISVFALFVEVTVLYSFNIGPYHETYVFLVPVVWFMFYLAINIRLPNCPVYKMLRTLSSLIYYLHLLVKEGVILVLKNVCASAIDTCLPFLLTLGVTALISLVIVRLSDYKYFKWLKVLYM